MKKLMIAAVAAVCGSVFALESANVVGYQNKEVRQNLSVQLPTFENIATEGINIQSIVPVAAEGDELESGDFVIQIYDDTGAQTASYAWVLGEDIDEGFADGWYEEDWETIVEKTFNAGEGFNVSAAKGGSLKFAALSL